MILLHHPFAEQSGTRGKTGSSDPCWSLGTSSGHEEERCSKNEGTAPPPPQLVCSPRGKRATWVTTQSFPAGSRQREGGTLGPPVKSSVPIGQEKPGVVWEAGKMKL